MARGIQVTEFSINLGVITAKFEVGELDRTLTSLVDEMRAITSILAPEQREVLRRIMAWSGEPLRVQQLFDRPFERDTDDHATLRKLRDAQFIRPRDSGPWSATSEIEVKQFGRIMWDKIGEEKLFAKKPSG